MNTIIELHPMISSFVGSSAYKPTFDSVFVEFMSHPKLLDRSVLEYVSYDGHDQWFIIIEELKKIRRSTQPFNCCSNCSGMIPHCRSQNNAYNCDGYQVYAIKFTYYSKQV